MPFIIDKTRTLTFIFSSSLDERQLCSYANKGSYLNVAFPSRNSSIVGMLLGVLEDMYKCDFSRLENLFVPTIQDNLERAGMLINVCASSYTYRHGSS